MPVGVACRGKSELHRADCQVTPGRREATERATENRPPLIPRVRVKRWGKSPPRAWQQAWHGSPESEQGQISGETRPGSSERRVGRVRWLATAIPERCPSARFGGQTELGLWPYRPPLDDLAVETLPRAVGAGRGPAGIPDDHPGVGKTHRVARRHAEARLEAAARRK